MFTVTPNFHVGFYVGLLHAIQNSPNTFIESFNGQFRKEYSATHWFLTLEDAKAAIGACRQEYNESRLHMFLQYMTPQPYDIVTSKTEPEASFESGTKNWERPIRSNNSVKAGLVFEARPKLLLICWGSQLPDHLP